MKKSFLLLAVLVLVATGCKKNDGNNPAKKTIDRSEYVGVYNYEITGTVKLNLTIIGETDFPISMDGTMTITEDPDDANSVKIVSKNFETTGLVSDEGLKIATFSSSSSGEDAYGTYSMTYRIENGVATLKDGVLTWKSNLEAEMDMTIVKEKVSGSGKGEVNCVARKQ